MTVIQLPDEQAAATEEEIDKNRREMFHGFGEDVP